MQDTKHRTQSAMTAEIIIFRCGLGKRFCCEGNWDQFTKTSRRGHREKPPFSEVKICNLCAKRIHKVQTTHEISDGIKKDLSIAFGLIEYLSLPREKKPFIEPITAERLKCPAI